MDWIHCNICYVQPSEGKAFSITNCGHMYCCDCVRNGTKSGKCFICKSECTVIQLAADMKNDVKEFFMEPDEMLSKLMQLLEFQKHHRMKLTTHWIKLNRKYKEAKNEIKRLNEISEKMFDDMKKFYKQNKELKSALSSFTNNEKSSPFTVPLSPGASFPTFASSQGSMPSSLSNARGRKSCVPQVFQSTLVTPLRLHKVHNTKDVANGGKKYQKLSTGSSYDGPSAFLTPQSINGSTPRSGYITTPTSVYSQHSYKNKKS